MALAQICQPTRFETIQMTRKGDTLWRRYAEWDYQFLHLPMDMSPEVEDEVVESVRKPAYALNVQLGEGTEGRVYKTGSLTVKHFLNRTAREGGGLADLRLGVALAEELKTGSPLLTHPWVLRAVPYLGASISLAKHGHRAWVMPDIDGIDLIRAQRSLPSDVKVSEDELFDGVLTAAQAAGYRPNEIRLDGYLGNYIVPRADISNGPEYTTLNAYRIDMGLEQ